MITDVYLPPQTKGVHGDRVSSLVACADRFDWRSVRP